MAENMTRGVHKKVFFWYLDKVNLYDKFFFFWISNNIVHKVPNGGTPCEKYTLQADPEN